MDEAEAQRKRHLHPAALAVAALVVSAVATAGVILSRHPGPAPNAAHPGSGQLLDDAATALRADRVMVAPLPDAASTLPIGPEAATEVANGGPDSIAAPVNVSYSSGGTELRTVAWIVVTPGGTPSALPNSGRPPLPNRADIPPLIPQPSFSSIAPTAGESGSDVVLVEASNAQILVSTWLPITSS